MPIRDANRSCYRPVTMRHEHGDANVAGIRCCTLQATSDVGPRWRPVPTWLDKQTQRSVMQRAGTLRCWGVRAPARCTTRPVRGKRRKQWAPSQASGGPNNLGRSRARSQCELERSFDPCRRHLPPMKMRSRGTSARCCSNRTTNRPFRGVAT